MWTEKIRSSPEEHSEEAAETDQIAEQETNEAETFAGAVVDR